jgi:hypothetical protein
MRRIITLSLLPVFLFSIIGWQWMFFLKFYSHEFKEWNSISGEEEFEVIVIKAAEAPGSRDTYFINKHEVIHHGKLFDVKLKKRRGDDLVLYCERDGAEENLLASFDSKTKDTFGNFLSANRKTQKIVKLTVFENLHELMIFNPGPFCEDLIPCPETFFCSSSAVNSFFVPPDAA